MGGIANSLFYGCGVRPYYVLLKNLCWQKKRGQLLIIFLTFYSYSRMTEAKWPLSPNQYADATITLEFPASAARRLEAGESSLDSLKNDFSSSQNFARSKNQKAMKKAIDKFLTDNIPLLGSGGKLKESEKFVEEGEEKESEIFAYEGIDLFYGKIEPKTKNKGAIGSSTHLRGSRQIQEVVEVIEVTYTFTTRGAYNVRYFAFLGCLTQTRYSFPFDIIYYSRHPTNS